MKRREKVEKQREKEKRKQGKYKVYNKKGRENKEGEFNFLIYQLKHNQKQENKKGERYKERLIITIEKGK